MPYNEHNIYVMSVDMFNKIKRTRKEQELADVSLVTREKSAFSALLPSFQS